MTDDSEETSVPTPIWHSPAWLTAMVAVVSAFLTVPNIVGEYLVAEQKAIAQSVQNENDKQALEFTIVNNTLAQQGAERIFVLRYLASTLDDQDARNWALEEVVRLDRLAKLEAELAAKTSEVAALRTGSNNASPEDDAEVEILRTDVRDLQNELQRLNAEAGIATVTNLIPGGFLVLLGSDTSLRDAQETVSAYYSDRPTILIKKRGVYRIAQVANSTLQAAEIIASLPEAVLKWGPYTVNRSTWCPDSFPSEEFEGLIECEIVE